MVYIKTFRAGSVPSLSLSGNFWQVSCNASRADCGPELLVHPAELDVVLWSV